MAEPPQQPAADRWIAAVPVAVFLVASAMLLAWWSDMVATQRESVEAHLRADAREVATKIAERLDAYDQILRGAAGLFAASDAVTREEFRRYYGSLQIGRAYKGIQGLGYVERIPPGRLDEFVRRTRAEGFPDFRVMPEGARPEYTAVLYLEPFTGRNLRAFGLDGFAEPVRRAAMEKARDQGEVATSGMVTLVQETGTDVQPGVLTFLPVYRAGLDTTTDAGRRAALRGWVYSPLRMRDLMDGILDEGAKVFRLEIFDGAGPGAALLFDSSPAGGPATIAESLPLAVNQRTWLLRFTAGGPYLASVPAKSPVLELGATAVIALLLTGLSVALVATRRQRTRESQLARSLRESEARFRAIFERAPVGIFTFGEDGRFLGANPRYCEITGWSPEELRGLARDQVVHPEDRERDAELMRRILSGEQAVGTLERRGVRKDGSAFWAEVMLSRDAPGRDGAASFVGVLDDVTARHDAQALFREIAERSLAGILILQDDEVTYANPAASELTGWSNADLRTGGDRLIRGLVHPDDRALVSRDREQELADPAAMPPVLSYRIVRPDGSVRRVERFVRQIEQGGRPATLYTILDVTDRDRIEEEMRKAQRLESLGLLAGGIAHDFNNLLTAVFGHVEGARSQLAPGSPAREDLDVALSALERSRGLTRQLLTFSTGGAPERKVLPVDRLVEEAVRLGLGGSAIRARVDLEPGLPPVEADEGQMSQLLSNLLVNARQATPGAGEVTIHASSRWLRAGEAPPLPPGRYVEIAVRDTGHGIPDHVLPKVFDPFFTTRPSGTGLGLATSYSIVRRHGGHIAIASRVGQGTTVTVLLPAAASQPPRAVEGGPAASSGPAPRMRVLLMDDEPLVLKVGVKNLRKMGCEVETATTGEEAVLAYRRAWAAGAPPDVVILDLTVPGGMGGAEAFERIREFDPSVAAIACSGYFEDGIMAEPGKFGFAGVLGKPYLAADLERVLAAVAAREA